MLLICRCRIFKLCKEASGETSTMRFESNINVSKLMSFAKAERSEISVWNRSRCLNSVNPDKGEKSVILLVCGKPSHLSFLKPFKGDKSVALQSYKSNLVRFVNPDKGERSEISECMVSNFLQFCESSQGNKTGYTGMCSVYHLKIAQGYKWRKVRNLCIMKRYLAHFCQFCDW